VLLRSNDLVSDPVAANPQLGVFPEEVTLVDSLTSAPVTRGSDVIIPTIERTKAAAADANVRLTLLFRETVRGAGQVGPSWQPQPRSCPWP
jgi:hypothetical protein